MTCSHRCVSRKVNICTYKPSRTTRPPKLLLWRSYGIQMVPKLARAINRVYQFPPVFGTGKYKVAPSFDPCDRSAAGGQGHMCGGNAGTKSGLSVSPGRRSLFASGEASDPLKHRLLLGFGMSGVGTTLPSLQARLSPEVREDLPSDPTGHIGPLEGFTRFVLSPIPTICRT